MSGSVTQVLVHFGTISQDSTKSEILESCREVSLAFQAGLVHQKPLYNQQVPSSVHLQVPLYVLLKILQAPYKCYGPTCNSCMALVGALPLQESALTFLAGYLTCQAVLLGCLTGPPCLSYRSPGMSSLLPNPVYLVSSLAFRAGIFSCFASPLVWFLSYHLGPLPFLAGSLLVVHCEVPLHIW